MKTLLNGFSCYKLLGIFSKGLLQKFVHWPTHITLDTILISLITRRFGSSLIVKQPNILTIQNSVTILVTSFKSIQRNKHVNTRTTEDRKGVPKRHVYLIKSHQTRRSLANYCYETHRYNSQHLKRRNNILKASTKGRILLKRRKVRK